MNTVQKVTDSEQIRTVAALAFEIWNQHFVSIIGQSQVDFMLEKFQSQKAISEQIQSGFEYYLCVVDDHPQGYLGLVPDHETGHVMISKIYIRAAARGLGLGNYLLGFVKQYCLQHVMQLTLREQHNQVVST